MLGTLTEVADTHVILYDVSGNTDVSDTQVVQYDLLNNLEETQILTWTVAGTVEDTQILTWTVADLDEDIVSWPARLERSIVRVDLAPSEVAVKLERSTVDVYVAEGGTD